MFVLRQFFVTAFYPARGGGPGQGGNGSAPPPVPNAVRKADGKDGAPERDESRTTPSAHGGKPKAGQRKDDGADQPGQNAAGIGNAVSTRKKPPPKKREVADGASKASKAKAAARRK